MKKTGIVLVILFGLLAFQRASAQKSTYILLRHAEKDTMHNDPPLTAAGRQRAQSLLEVLKDYQPDLIYSTDYSRTRSTVTPLAKKFGKEILLYDPAKLNAFSEELLRQKGKTIIVAGHSNTTPALVNLLLKDNKYPAMQESVYNQFWIVTVSESKIDAKLVVY